MLVKFGIRNRLLISFLILIVTTLVSLGGYVLWFFKDYYQQHLTMTLQTDAKIIEELLRVRWSPAGFPEDIDSHIKDLGQRIDLRITLADANGNVLADSDDNPSAMENHRDRPEIAAALAGETGVLVRFSKTVGESFLYVAIPLYDSSNQIVGIVRVSTSLAHVKAGYNQIQSVLLGSFLAASLLAIAISFRLARRFTAPLESISKAAEEIGQGQLDKRVHIKTGDEIEILARTLNNLASSLEEQLKKIISEKQKLELILQQTDNAVILFDRYGNVTDINLRASTLFSPSSPMIGRHNIELIGSSALDKAIRETIQENTKRTIELVIGSKSAKRVFHTCLSPLYEDGGVPAGVLGVLHDITALKEIYNRQADFVANASHELSTPLTAIKGFAETLLDGAMQDPELTAKFVKIIQNEAERMHRLVKDLLQIARLQSEEYRGHVGTGQVRLRPLVEAVIQDLSPLWREKDLTLTADIPDTVTVRGNPDWLKTVFVNLLDNSIKYTPRLGKIFVECKVEGDDAVIAVSDSGIGMSEKDIPFIFERFYRVDRARTRAIGGTGLGLSIVKFIVETLGGKINVSSKLGVGTTFTFTLKLD